MYPPWNLLQPPYPPMCQARPLIAAAVLLLGALVHPLHPSHSSSAWSPLQPPCTVRCCAATSLQSAYLECDGNSTVFTLVEDGLGELESPDGQGSVPAVFNWVTNGAALPGAIGTRGCDCEGVYGNGTLGALWGRGGLQGGWDAITSNFELAGVEGWRTSLRWSRLIATT